MVVNNYIFSGYFLSRKIPYWWIVNSVWDTDSLTCFSWSLPWFSPVKTLFLGASLKRIKRGFFWKNQKTLLSGSFERIKRLFCVRLLKESKDSFECVFWKNQKTLLKESKDSFECVFWKNQKNLLSVSFERIKRLIWVHILKEQKSLFWVCLLKESKDSFECVFWKNQKTLLRASFERIKRLFWVRLLKESKDSFERIKRLLWVCLLKESKGSFGCIFWKNKKDSFGCLFWWKETGTKSSGTHQYVTSDIMQLCVLKTILVFTLHNLTKTKAKETKGI